MTKRFLYILSLLLLLSNAACGTIQFQFIPNPGATPTFTPAPSGATPAYASPQQCEDLPYDAALPANPDEPTSYIGGHYDQLALPPGLEFKAASLLTDDLLWMWVSRATFDMQFLAAITCRSADGSAYTTVLDAIWIPRAAGHYDRAGLCSPLPDSSPIIVFGNYNPNQAPVLLNGVQGWQMFDLDFAQRVNFQTQRFEPLPMIGLECIYIISGMGN